MKNLQQENFDKVHSSTSISFNPIVSHSYAQLHDRSVVSISAKVRMNITPNARDN
jgi:hypothetical protein